MRSALRLVWALDVRHLLAHRARLALAALGIAAGVSLAVGVSALGSSIDASLRSVANAAASDANVEVRPNAETGIPPEVLQQVRDVPGVAAAGATVESYTRIRSDGEATRILLLGVDQGILELSPEAVDPSTFEGADPFGLMLPEPLATDLGVSAGETIEVATPGGWQEIGVGAVLPPQVTERGRIAVGAVGVVQGLLGRGTAFDAIYVSADDPDAVVPRIQRIVEGRGRVGPIALRREQVGQLLEATTTSFNAAAIVALFVGAFLVYNTMAMTAVERVQEAALLRAVGARRRQVFALFCTEGGVLGLIGSAVGIGGGVLLARVLLAGRGGPLADVFPIEISRLSFEPMQLAAAGISGVVAALAAAYLPARRIANSDPAPALGPAGALEDPTERSRGVLNVVGALAIVAGVPVAVYGVVGGAGRQRMALAGFVLTLGGIALLIRTILPIISRLAFGPLTGRHARTSGLVRLAANEVLRSPGRTAFTAGAVLLALALVVGFTMIQSSFSSTFELRFDEILRADLYVRSATWRATGSDVPLDRGLADELRRVPGVEVAYPFRVTTASVRNEAVLVIAYDFDDYAELPGLSPEWRREVIEQARLVDAPDAILASPSVTERLGVEVGESLDVPTPTGTHELELAGTIPDPSAVIPELFIDYDDFERMWSSQGADAFPIGLAAGVDPIEVKERIVERFGPTHGIEVDTREQYQDRINSLVEGTLSLISSVQLVAVIVAGLGLANTLLISTLERRRDIGVLRAVGMLRRQVRRMVVIEALFIGGLGVLCAWGLGTVIGYGMVSIVEAQVGVPLTVNFPLWGYAAAGLLGLVAATVAALYPAHRASVVDVVEALHYE